MVGFEDIYGQKLVEVEIMPSFRLTYKTCHNQATVVFNNFPRKETRETLIEFTYFTRAILITM